MFDQKEDKKILKVEIVKFLEKDKKNNLKKLYSLLKSIKILVMYFFAFVGFSLIFYHFLMGQPYQCTTYKRYNPDEPILSQTEDTIIDPIDCEYSNQELVRCREEKMNITDNCTKYCLTDIFKPVCEDLFGSV